MSKDTHPDHGVWIFRARGNGSAPVAGWQLVKGSESIETWRQSGETLVALQRRHLAACRELADCPPRPVSVALAEE
ncbi:hypothetical protein CK501_05620 [Halovibrio salipaludis]|uniref:Uncharacterized protein n=1 Tax=Halovibrio salipaludis TaxID=2032626 RepID=A0A2A2F638_9GAMM|nr:hypothetical protein [Halovibrio salipaludis]PAU81041.1 hypothetical protein CK501_05620 [Halovibrio salipaludis]